MFLVIATAYYRGKHRVTAIEQASDDDFPPSPNEIIGRWLAQGVIGSREQAQIWTDAAGWYYTPVDLPGER